MLFILIVLDLAANMVQIYFNLREEWEYQMKAAIWARSLDWATAAGSIGAFSSYRALVVATPNLLRAASSIPSGQIPSITSGTVAANLFGAIVGISVAGAVVNTLLTMSEVGSAVATNGAVYNKRPVVATGVKASSISPPASKADISRPDYVPVYKRRAAYEVFP